MNVRSITLIRFMGHDKTTVELPRTGLVAITGPNGAGKSSIVEGVSLAMWGETLRGTPTWRDDSGSVVVETYEGLRVELTRKKNKDSLIFSQDQVYETTTKARAALEARIGSWDVWRRSSVFSSADAPHFTLSSDAERKRLLESILGIDQFDAALEACRRDLKVANALFEASKAKVEKLGVQLVSKENQLDETDHQLAQLPPDVDDATLGVSGDEISLKRAECSTLRKSLDQVTREVSDIEAKYRGMAEGGAEERALAKQLRSTLDRLKAKTCPTCTQTIPEKLRQDLTKKATEAEETSERVARQQDEARREIETSLKVLREERRVLQERHREATSAIAASDAVIATRARLLRLAETLKKEIDALQSALKKAAEEAKKSSCERATLDVVDTVLSTKGVRAHVLSRSLGGVEAIANAWLARLAGDGLRLALKPYTERKSGAVSDSISLDITGAGNGYGYRAASQGERRRLDVSLLLALGEVAAAAHGQRPGTIWTDEVFDALDDDGQEAVVEVLRELSAERAVCVITHSPQLVELLKPDHHWTVSNGRLTL